MVDVVDVANDVEETMLAAKLSERKPIGPEPTGYCLNCAEHLFEKTDDNPTGPRWCDADCRQDWETFNTRGAYG